MKIENKNKFHAQIDPKSDPEYIIITMRDGAKIFLPKNNMLNSWANIKTRLNKYLKDDFLEEYRK